MATTTRRAWACHHEAGHCVARWYFGAGTDIAEIFDDEARRYGITVGGEDRLFRSSGRLSGKALMFETSKDLQMPEEICDSYRRIGHARAEMQLLCTVAGAVAEARYRKSKVVGCWMAAEADREVARRVGLSWLTDMKTALDLAFERAEALMRSAPGGEAVTTIARRLQRNGRIDGREIDAISEFAFGRQQPGLYDWNDHWPVDLARLREGWLPPDHQSEDGIPQGGVRYEARA